MRENSKKLSINRLNSRNLYLDQIRPHGLAARQDNTIQLYEKDDGAAASTEEDL